MFTFLLPPLTDICQMSFGLINGDLLGCACCSVNEGLSQQALKSVFCTLGQLESSVSLTA